MVVQTLETVQNRRRSAVSKILKPPCLAPTIIPRSKSLALHFFPIGSWQTFGLKNSWTSWPCLHAFMPFNCCHMICWLDICINKLMYRSLSVYCINNMKYGRQKIIQNYMVDWLFVQCLLWGCRDFQPNLAAEHAPQLLWQAVPQGTARVVGMWVCCRDTFSRS